MRVALRRTLAGLVVLTAGALALAVPTIAEPRTGACLFPVPLTGDVQAGDLAIHSEEAEVLGVGKDVIWARALGLSPRIEVAWRGSGLHGRPVELRLENLNLRACSIELSTGASELSRRGGTLAVKQALGTGFLRVAATPRASALASGRFVLVGCSRSNSLMPQILERLEKEPPLFVLHLGDLSHGLAYECEAIRASFDRIGVPIFVSPGNHDVFPWHSLQSFHRYLNVAPFAFTVAGQRFFVLDVADYPIAPAQLDWLEEGIRSAGESRSWVFLHRSPKDPLGLGREFPPKDGAARLESIVSMARDARTYAAHLGGYGKGTFGGHPFVMTSGGGERHKKENDAGPYHHLSVSLDGREGEVVTYDEPSFAGRILSRVQIEGPVFFSRPLLGLGGAALAALLLRLLSPRMSRRRLGSGTEAAPARETAPAPVLEPREARAS